MDFCSRRYYIETFQSQRKEAFRKFEIFQISTYRFRLYTFNILTSVEIFLQPSGGEIQIGGVQS